MRGMEELVKCGHLRTRGGVKDPCVRPQASTFFVFFSMLCGRSLWVMPMYEL